MKLHLPTRLRKALLACLAVAVPTLSTTLASGSALLAALSSPLHAEEPSPADPTKKMPDEWNQLEGGDLKDFDATKDITKDGQGNWIFGESVSTETGKMYFVWDTSSTEHTLKFFKDETELGDWKNEHGYEGDVFSITYQNTFGSGSNGKNYGLDMSGTAGFGLLLSDTGSDIRITGTTHPGTATMYVTSPQDTIDGVFYGKNQGTEIGNTNFSGIDTGANGGKAGAAVSLKQGVSVQNITADFIGNYLSSTGDDHAAAIYVDYNATVGTIKGNFIGNYIKDNRKIVGGAILNWGKIDKLQGTFIANHLETASNSSPVGGVIANGAESFNSSSIWKSEDAGNDYSVIEHLNGYFIGNYVTSNGALRDTIGGTIANYGRIGDITGVFIGNFAFSDNTANSGVLRNYSRNNGEDTRIAVIGAADADWNDSEKRKELEKKTVISGVFIGNYAQGTAGDGYGGVMRNNGEIRGVIDGIFVGNYAITQGNQINASNLNQRNTSGNGTYTSYGQVGSYDYLKAGNDGFSRQDRAMAYGGAIYNEVKNDPQATGDAGQVAIGDIRGEFHDNYVNSTYGEAFGGAIFNQDASIQNITAKVFRGNHAVSDYYVARGGAIYDNKDGINYSAEIGTIGAENQLSLFTDNFAKGKMAQGGVIFVANGATAKNVYANFTGNYTISEVNDNENQYYADNIQNRNKDLLEGGDQLLTQLADSGLHPIAQGGAIYVAQGSQMNAITGSFTSNFARTTGIGYSTERAKDGERTVAASNAYHYAQGGAIFVDKGNTDSITGSFSGNYVETLGLIHEADITAKAQGGAIYVNAGSIQNITGDFYSNEAATYSLGDSQQDVQGGAIYLASGGTMQEITGNFISNKVISAERTERDEETRGNVDSYYSKNFNPGSTSTNVTAQGGAMYVDGTAHAKDVVGNFEKNAAVSQATGNGSETVQGGAIYIANKGYIDNIGAYDSSATDPAKLGFVQIKDNSLTAKGHGSELEKQDAQGGAIYVSEAGSKGYSIQNIYAGLIQNNTITINVDNTSNTNLTERNAQGGAIYLANMGVISDIGAKGWITSIGQNSITVTGGHESNTTKLVAQGGAVYANDGAHSANIFASFTQNTIDTSKANGNKTETLAGGAIYLAEKAYIENIGSDDAMVQINGNKLTAGGLGENMQTQEVQGGAIYVATAPTEGKSIGNIYAAQINENKINAGAGDSDQLNTRDIQGGAFYLFDKASVGDIGKKGSIAEIYRNTVTVTGGNKSNEIALTTGGGAIFAGLEAQVGNIYASFVQNGIDTQEADGNQTESLQGGAIYLRGGAAIKNIGSSDARVQVSENYLTAGGKGENLTTQEVQGGAFYLGMNPDTQQHGQMGAIYADFKGNRITADVGATTKLQERNIQGGAIYLKDGSEITSITEAGDVVEQVQQPQLSTKELAKQLMDSILHPVAAPIAEQEENEHGFVDNSITVTGGEDGGKAELYAQGGAIYLAGGAEVGAIQASFIHNTITTKGDSEKGTTDANGNSIERLAGGAIYVAGGGVITGDIGSEDHIVSIKENGLTATGHGSQLTEQWARGGAIFVGEDDGASGKLQNIYANITDNSIGISADSEGNEQLEKRYAMGGALYVADGGQIGAIYQSKDGEGITRNSITVEGGVSDNSTKLEAMGGALFVSDNARVNGVMASFTLNSINTFEATGNATETVGGGAIYLAKKASVQAIGDKDNKVEISGNSITAGGKGEKLTSQTVQGGAIYASSQPADEDKPSIGEIYADITGNSITAAIGDSEQVTSRTIQGGAIYLAEEGAITSITKKDKGITNNTIAVTGGNSEGAALTVQGGAIFVSSESTIGNINADFNENGITSNGTNNASSLAQGGAIYVAGGGEIKDIGIKETPVEFNSNYVSIGANAVKDGTEGEKVEKHAMGGAIYLSKDDKGHGTLGDVYASFTGNYAQLVADGNYVNAQAYGGAVFVSEGSTIGNITGDFKYNYAKSDLEGAQPGKGSDEMIHGGAIDVAYEGRAGQITGSFIGNYVQNSGREVAADKPEDVLDDEKYATGMHAKGGAIYLAKYGSIDVIGSKDSWFTGNYAQGSGQVRGGAILVTNAYVNDIAGTFYGNYAKGTESLATFGGAIRFDDAMLVRLESNFYNNHTTGTGGALSLTKDGVIYEITGDFKGNYSALNGGGVEALGAIGLRGYAVTEDGQAPASDFSNVQRKANSHELETKRDSTDQRLGYDYQNKEGRYEYDGSFIGGFVNSDFLYNTVVAKETTGDLTTAYLTNGDIKSQYYRGAGIYTDRDLFITANDKKEVIMSGNKIEIDGQKKRSAIYVDNKEARDTADDYRSIVVYLVAQDDAVLRIDDNIRGHEASEDGLVVRLRGYADKHYTTNPYDTSGLIILNNRVEKAYTVMDDVTLYIGYKPRTYNDETYFKDYDRDSLYKGYEDAKIGDETLQNIIMDDKKSTYLDVAGTASRDGKAFKRSNRHETDTTQIEFHQSDIFRDSFMSVRSGTVALTENTYSNRRSGKFSDMDSAEVYTEYLFGGLIAYGADYNYGDYGTNDTTVADEYKGSSMATKTPYGSQQYPYRGGNEQGRYATFEFGISFNSDDLYDLALANRYYYADMNNNPTEKSFWVDEKGATHTYEYYTTEKGERVHVEHRMAKSDMLTVFAVWDDKAGEVKWDNAARGRVTLNGLTINNIMSDYEAYLTLTNKSVSGAQQDTTLAEDKNGVLAGDGFNRDLYVQLINYMLVDAKGNLVTDQKTLQSFYAKFDEAEEENNGYHLLRLSDHFNLIHNPSWYMRGSDILADEIELATTVTKDDSLHIVNWRDHLAEWAEHEASWDGTTYGDVKDAEGAPLQEPKETAGLYTGKKHFVLDQNVYYLNRNINIEANPTTNNYESTGAQMWGQYLTIEGVSKNKELNLQEKNMLSLVIPDQQVRLQSFTLTNVKGDARVSAGLIQNEGDLILDTMEMEKNLTINNTGMDYTGKKHGSELDNRSYTLDNRLTVTGVMDINFTITTLDSEKTGLHGKLFINHSTEVVNRALPDWVDPEPETPTTPEPDADMPDADIPDATEPEPTLPDTGDLTPETGSGLATASATDGISTLNDTIPTETVTDNTAATEPVSMGDRVLSESIVHITGVVEHQDVTHQGEDQMELGNETLTYDETGEEQKLGTWYIKTGNRDSRDVRETFTSNTYLDTTEKSDYKTATPQFLAFRDNSLTMEGGAFNLGTMYKHRLPLRYFYVNGGSVFVDHSTINLAEERMGGIDAKDGDAKYAGDFEDTKGKNTSGTGDGLIWLQGFTIEDTSEKYLVHVKFVDDGVGNAVKDGMGIANGAEKSNMRLMRDGKRKYIWQVTYNDERAENDYEEVYKGKTGVKGMYTFYRMGFTPESQEGPVTDLTGSYVTMMQVYNYSFQHADLYSTNIAAAREQQLYADHYSAVDVKGKGSVAPVEDTCPPSTAGLRSGLWLHTYASTETMPLRNGPEVRLNMYGGLVGGDSALKEHRNGWASVWSLYGGYVGSTQKYEDVRIRQNGAALGLTGTFYKKKFYTALTASVGVASATANSYDCKDDFDLIMGGIASRSGYSFEFDNGRYILQPNLMLSYTLFNTCDYTNAYGSRVTAKPTGLLQINPFVKFIKNTDCTWKPYAKLGLVYNALGKTKYTFDGTSLPSMSIKPYVEYSIGAQRTWRDRYTLYGEVTGRNGGRNGAEASAGIRIAW